MSRSLKSHWDVLIYHSNSSDHSEQLAQRLKDLLHGLQDEIGEKPKIASTAEHFATGSMFSSMEDALESFKDLSNKCSWMFIIITDDLLNDPMGLFHNNQALTHSIFDKGGDKYVPIYEDRQKMTSLPIPSYIKMLRGVCIRDLETSTMTRTSIVNTIKGKLIERKTREEQEVERQQMHRITERFVAQLKEIKRNFERRKRQLTGTAEVEALQRQCTAEIEQIAKEQDITDIDAFITKHSVDVSFLSQTSSGFFSGSDQRPSYISVNSAPNQLPENIRSPNREPVEHDDAVEDDDMTGHTGASSGTHLSNQSTYRIGGHNSSGRMEELKPPTAAPPAEHRVEVVGHGEPLDVPPCESADLPIFLSEFTSNKSGLGTGPILNSFSSVPRSLRTRDIESDSMIAECSEASVRDSTSLLGSQSNANLAELDDESMSQFSNCGSANSTGDIDMDTGEHQVDLSLLETATGLRPLPMQSFGHRETDDESMVVEVDSTVGEEEITFNNTPTVTPFKQPTTHTPKEEFKEPFKVPPSRVMHRSYCEEDDPGEIEPLEIDTAVEDATSSTSPGLGGLASWPRARRGSDTFRDRRSFHSNLRTTRFLSLSSIQSLSSKLSMLHQHPSLNNISELGERPRLLDGIRTRFGW